MSQTTPYCDLTFKPHPCPHQPRCCQFQVVAQLRQQRVGMVQTPEQYLFCYRAVAEELAEAGIEGPDEQAGTDGTARQLASQNNRAGSR